MTMKMTMAIHVKRSRFDKEYYASIYDGYGFPRTGRTQTDAYNACQEAIEKQARYGNVRRYVFSVDGPVFAFYYADGWCYDIVQDSSPVPPSCMMPYDVGQDEAYQSMINHINSGFGGIKGE